MLPRNGIVLLTGIGLVIALCAVPVFATEVFQGKIVSVSKDMLTIEGPRGKNSTFFVAKEASILRNGQPTKLTDLKPNDLATVTTDNKMVAIIISVRAMKDRSLTLAPNFAIR